MSPPQTRQTRPRMLVVGDVARWRTRGLTPAAGDGLHFTSFADLTAALLGAVSPEIVLSALMSEGHDAIDVAGRLAQLRYIGRYRVVAPGVPRPDLIRREVAAAAPGLDFDLLVIDALLAGGLIRDS